MFVPKFGGMAPPPPAQSGKVIPPMAMLDNTAKRSSDGKMDREQREVIPGRFYGTIKSYNADKGFGFIACPQVFSIFNRDIFVHRREFERADAPVGGAVSFFVELNTEGHPQARNTQILPEALGKQLGLDGSGASDPNLPAAMQKLAGGPGDATNVGWQLASTLRMGGPSADGVREHLLTIFPIGMGGDEALKSFVRQQDVLGEKEIAQYLAVQAKSMGDHEGVSGEDMDARQEDYGRFAAALRLQYAAAAAQCADVGGETPSSVISNNIESHFDEMGRAKKAVGAFTGHDPSRRFHGQIAKWLDEEGYGFVRCPESQKIYGKDIFLHKAQIGSEADLYKQRTQMGLMMGNKVTFGVEVQRGMPRAKDVILVALAELEAREREERGQQRAALVADAAKSKGIDRSRSPPRKRGGR